MEYVEFITRCYRGVLGILNKQTNDVILEILERIVVLMYDRVSSICKVDAARQKIFSNNRSFGK